MWQQGFYFHLKHIISIKVCIIIQKELKNIYKYVYNKLFIIWSCLLIWLKIK
jgi:hypothetical protein